MFRKTVLIAGASGVVGHAALEHFATLPDWRVIAVSRRRPSLPAGFDGEHLALDLGDAAACSAALSERSDISHVVFAALFEKPGLVRGWRERDQMETNRAMLVNLLTPLTSGNPGLRHVSLLQGTKAYGVHLHPVAVPARESAPRDPHDNFYWLQEDWLRARADACGFDFTIWRPQLVFGDALGVAMNLIPVIGAYAAICRALGKPMAYPGGPSNILEATDARLLARAFAWAASATSAHGQTFNITNGDVFVWRNVWPEICAALGVKAGPDAPQSMARWLPAHADVWDAVVAQHRLAATPLAALLGESHHYADFCFGFHARESPPPVIVSTIRLREAGFGDCIDTERMFRECFSMLQRQRVLPSPHA